MLATTRLRRNGPKFHFAFANQLIKRLGLYFQELRACFCEENFLLFPFLFNWKDVHLELVQEHNVDYHFFGKSGLRVACKTTALKEKGKKAYVMHGKLV